MDDNKKISLTILLLSLLGLATFLFLIGFSSYNYMLPNRNVTFTGDNNFTGLNSFNDIHLNNVSTGVNNGTPLCLDSFNNICVCSSCS